MGTEHKENEQLSGDDDDASQKDAASVSKIPNIVIFSYMLSEYS